MSEVRVYGRAVGDANLVFTSGDGLADTTMTFQGPLAALNTALAGLTYTPDLNYNSGDATAPEALLVHVDDVVGGVRHTGAMAARRRWPRRRTTR